MKLALFGIGGQGTGNQSYDVELSRSDPYAYPLYTITISCNGVRIDRLEYEKEDDARDEFKFIVNLITKVLKHERDRR